MKVKISKYPTGWPIDGRSVTRVVDGKIVIFHPDRKGYEQEYDVVSGIWKMWDGRIREIAS